MARTLAALRAAADGPEPRPLPRRRIMTAILKAAAAALLAAAGLLYFGPTPPAEATGAFVEAAQRLRDAHTLSFRMTMQVAGQGAPATARLLYKEPGLVRSEAEP